MKATFPEYPIMVNAFEAGVLMGLITEQKAKVPRVWKQLLALKEQFKAQAGVTTEDLGQGMVKLTAQDGTIIIRQKYDWEES